MKIKNLYNCNSINPYMVAEMEDGSLKCARKYNGKLVLSHDFQTTGLTKKDLIPMSDWEYNFFYKDLVNEYNG